MTVENVLIQAELGRFGKRWSFLGIVLIGLMMSGSASAQVQLDRFFPPAVAAGEQTTIAAEGKSPEWPVSIACSREDITFAAQEKSGALSVTVDQDAPPGVAWVRLYDPKSASKLVPILISQVGVTQEKEPNDKRPDANELALPSVVVGRLQKSGDSDGFRVAAKSGKPFVVSATANQVLQSPMDAVLQITDLRGNVLAQSDDRRGLDPQLVFTPDKDQELLIRIFAFPSTPNSTVGFGGGSTYVYTLDVTQGPFLDHAVVAGSETLAFGHNVENDSVQQFDGDRISPPTAYLKNALGWSFVGETKDVDSRYFRESIDVTIPAVVYGHFSRPKESHSISFSGKAGTLYRADVRSKVDGFLFDSKLEAIEVESGKVLASNDDVSRGGYDAAVQFTPKSDGDIEIRLVEMLDGFGPRHFYQLSIRPLGASFTLSVAADRFVLSPDKPLEIPVFVRRESGLNRKIRIEVQNLPEGVTCEPVISETTGDTAKGVKLKLEAGDLQSGYQKIRIIGRDLDDIGDANPTPVVASFVLRPSIAVKDFWLTLAEQEEAKEK